MHFYKSTIILVSLCAFLIPSALAQAKKPDSNFQILEERVKLHKEIATLQSQNLDGKIKNFEEKNKIKLKAQNDNQTLLIQELESRLNIYLSVIGFIFALLSFVGLPTLSKYIKKTIETRTLEEITKKVTEENIEEKFKKSGEQAIKNLIKELNDTMKTEFSRIKKLRDNYEKELPDLLAKTKDIPTKSSEESSQELKDFEQKLTAIKKEKDYSANDWFLKGYNNSTQDNHQEAINDYTKTIELHPNNAQAYNNRGISFSYLRQYEQAIEDYNKAIELDPNFELAYTNRGVSFSYLKQYKSAIEDYNKAIKLDSNYARAYTYRGNSYSGLKQYEQAMEDYNKAIELDPSYARTYTYRGNSFSYLKQYKQAIEDYNKAIKLDPNFALAYKNRAELLIIVNKPKQALETCEKILVSVTDEGDKIILNYLACIAKKILKQNTEANYKNLIDLLQSDFSINWSFKEIETWVKNEPLDEEVKIFIKEITAAIKEKMVNIKKP